MPVKRRHLAACWSFPALLTSCFFEASGCTDNVCVNVQQETCSGYNCTDELYCEDSIMIEQRLAEIISSARNKARKCGSNSFDNASAVYWNNKLASAARQHSSDMASNNFLSHTGSEGTTVEQRVNGVGYEYHALAENIAGGQQTSTDVVSDWLDSTGHCSNIMNPRLREIGAACVRDLRSDYDTYWTLVMAAPKTP